MQFYAKSFRARYFRWRAVNPEKWKRMRQAQYYAATRKNKRRRGKAWTTEEDRMIVAKRRPSDRELSAKLGRSMQAIYRRRTKLRKSRQQ